MKKKKIFFPMVIVKSLISSIFSDMHIIDIAYLFAQS